MICGARPCALLNAPTGVSGRQADSIIVKLFLRHYTSVSGDTLNIRAADPLYAPTTRPMTPFLALRATYPQPAYYFYIDA